MTRHALRRGSKLLAAAIVASAGAAIAPAHAIVGTPTPLGNSVPNGFTKTPSAVAITYNAKIDPLTSSVSVLDVNGAPVAGTIDLGVGERTLIFKTTSASLFNEDQSPYTATFTARAVNQAAATASSVEALTFDVDFITPFPPNVHLNDAAPIAGPTVSAGDELVINGTAADITSETGIVSGVKKIDIHFYNPLANPTQLNSAGVPEVASMHKTVAIDCTAGCPTSATVAYDLGDLPTGYWNVKVSVTDAAGNQSAQSTAMPVLRIAAPA